VDLHPVVEDVHANVVAGEAVGPVDDGVDQSLEPCVLRHDRHIAETPLPGQRTTCRGQLDDPASRVDKNVRDRALEAFVRDELLTLAAPAFATAIADDPRPARQILDEPLEYSCSPRTPRAANAGA
jgi:hypothetical protein